MHGGTRLCGLTPVRAPPTSHQVHSCSHQETQDLCVALDSLHQVFHSGAVDSCAAMVLQAPPGRHVVPQTPLAARMAILKA